MTHPLRAGLQRRPVRVLVGLTVLLGVVGTASAQETAPRPTRRPMLTVDPTPLVLLETDPPPSWRTGGPESLPPSRYSDMETLLEKTIFQVDVAWIRVRVDRGTALRLKDLLDARGAVGYSDELADQVTEIVLQAPDAWIQMRFVRGANLGQFLGGIRENMDKAVRAEFVSRSHFDRISDRLPTWYSFLEDRGVKDGDVGFYRIHDDSLRTVYSDEGGAPYLDRIRFDPPARFMVLGSYFAPDSDFREGLVKSLLLSWHRRERAQPASEGSR